MVDDRIRETAKVLLDYSTRTKSGDRVLIRVDAPAKDLALEVYGQALLRGAYPWIRPELPGTRYVFHKYASDAQLGFTRT